MAAFKSQDLMCRLCMEEKSDVLLIFGSEGLQRRVAQKLRACLPVLVYKTDPLPKQICQFCAARLDDAYEFREHCLNVYRGMHARLLTMKRDSLSVTVFLDAMVNSPDPCQVQLCNEKSRAPPPLVPLPMVPMQPLENDLEDNSFMNHVMDQPLPDIPCEVQIKEEPSDSVLNHDSAPHESNETDYSNHETESNDCDGNKTTSILEQVLKGNLTLTEHKKDSKGKSALSSQWWCSLCNNYYRSRESLVKHMQVFCPRRYTCRKCNRVFYTVKDLAIHDGMDHLRITFDEDEVLNKCHGCDREYVSWEMLRNHRLREHVGQSIQVGTNTWCHSCNRFFPTLDSYNNHMLLHQPEQPPNKVPPMVTVPIIHHLEIDRRKEFNDTGKSLACPTCGKVCTQQSALSNHMRTHEPKRFKCDVCGRSFGLYVRLMTHKATEHKLPKNLVTSSMEQEDALNEEREAREARTRGCTRAFVEVESENEFDGRKSKRNSAPVEIISESHVKRFTCKTCKKSFKERWILKRHETTHRKSMTRTYTCNVCNQVFLDQDRYKAHQSVHNIDRSYHCSKCNKIFFKEYSLMSHICVGKSLTEKGVDGSNKNLLPKTLQKPMQQQLATKKYQCPECDRFFDTLQLMNAHARTHSDPLIVGEKKNVETRDKSRLLKPNVELMAGTSMITREVNNQKARQENPPPPVKRTLIRTGGGYRCGVCQSPFVLRELAVAHLRSAHPVMPYQCPYCKKRFTTQYTFTHHIKTNHPNESEK